MTGNPPRLMQKNGDMDRGMRDWPSDAELKEQRRARRAEVLALPMLPLRKHGYLKAPDELEGSRQAGAVGVGADSVALAVWPAADGTGVQITVHKAGEAPSAGVMVRTSLDADFVQPLPGGRVLLAETRATGADNAEVWTDQGRRECAGQLGDAIEHVLTSPSGAVWVGYFDEAIGGAGPEGHGLVRFTPALRPEWFYPFTDLPPIDDLYALNVAGETAYCCSYSSFHLISVQGDQVRDHGRVPVNGATQLLIDGDRAALIGGYGPEYDVITPVLVSGDSVEPAGQQRRLVLPDGMEIPRTQLTGRGPDLHLITDRGTWYRLALDDLPRAE